MRRVIARPLLEQGRDRGVGRYRSPPTRTRSGRGSGRTRIEHRLAAFGRGGWDQRGWDQHWRTGAVAAVATKAITTIIANSIGLMTPRSKRMFRTIIPLAAGLLDLAAFSFARALFLGFCHKIRDLIVANLV
jgi:hypothetical protein